MTATLEKYLGLLPIDLIIDRILPYTYRPQNPELMTDMRHFFESRKTVFESEKHWWSLIALRQIDYDPDHDVINYGACDIGREIMDSIFDFLGARGMINVVGPERYFHHRLFRGWRMTDKEWINALETNNNEVQVNICWALLTVSERKYIVARYENRIKNLLSVGYRGPYL